MPRDLLWRLQNLLVAMGRHVSGFVNRLFTVGADARAIDRRTRELDDLFRFKVDFVRRRALPSPQSWRAPRAIGRRRCDGGAQLVGDVDGDFELALARAGLRPSRSRENRQSRSDAGDRRVETMVRGPGSRSARTRSWGGFPFPGKPGLLAPGRDSKRRRHSRRASTRASCSEGVPRENCNVRPQWRQRRRDGFT